jgi:hypothetical protein
MTKQSTTLDKKLKAQIKEIEEQRKIKDLKKQIFLAKHPSVEKTKHVLKKLFGTRGYEKELLKKMER